MIVKQSEFLFANKGVYLYTGDSCVLVKIISYREFFGEWRYEIDCSCLSKGLILTDVPERFLGFTVNKKKGNESLTREYVDSLIKDNKQY